MNEKTLSNKDLEFNNEKKNILKKMIVYDKSKKGSIDEEIKELVFLINSIENYYTTSSCAGRIMLIKVDKNRRKDKSEWLYVTHKEAKFKEMKRALEEGIKNAREGESIWFKQEPLILHVCAKNLESANKILTIARDSGLKKSGIITLSRRIIIEIEGTENISALVAKNCNKEKIILTDDLYLKALVDEANRKMLLNKSKNRNFFERIKREFGFER
ncbi:MAG: tRNA wybutosine-synthesizing 3 family protein [Candidatus Woesearchaeota archaeon]